MNEAVAIGHREGILTAASLMVGEPHCREAVSIARKLPSLRIGLHLVLTQGRPILPPPEVSELVDRRGQFRGDLIDAGFRMFLRPRARRQLAAEIGAQFEAFRATGLALDHVNAHRHFHLHPTIAGLVFKIAPRYGAPALRIPIEPKDVVTAVDGRRRPGYQELLAAPWARLLRSRARRAGLASPESVFGLAWTGAMTERRLAGLLARLPDGVTEIYTHPATAAGFAGAAPGYRYEEELAALISPAARAALSASGARTGGFADLTPSAAARAA